MQINIKMNDYCKLSSFNVLGGYVVDQSLGDGMCAEVWSCYCCRTNDRLAIKVYTSDPDMIDYFQNEVMIFKLLSQHGHCDQVVSFHDMGAYVSMATNDLGRNIPQIHPFVVMSLGYESLTKLVKMQNDMGLPLNMVKRIMRDIFTGLGFMHECNIIHGDIKPRNILLGAPLANTTHENICAIISDVGSSTLHDDIFDGCRGSTEYMSPEMIIENPISFPTDIWSAFATCYFLITGHKLFDVYKETGVEYGEDTDNAALEGLELMVDATSSDDSNYEDDIDPQLICYRQLLLIAKVIGYPPTEFTDDARTYYNRSGRLKNNPDLDPISICGLLQMNVEMALETSQEIENFLLTGLKYMPGERITALAALNHQWLA